MNRPSTRNVRWLVTAALLLANAARAAESSYGYFELRIYSVTSNKLDAVLERFREAVDPVRRQHGIATLGYWTAATTNGQRFLYLLAASSRAELQRQEKEFGEDPKFREGYAASNQKHGKTVDAIISVPLRRDPEARFDFTPANQSRAFDLRIYSVHPERLSAFRDRWRDHAVPLSPDHGLQNIGWWTAESPDADGNPQFVCLLAAESAEAIQRSITEFDADPRWQRVEKEAEREGKLQVAVRTFTLIPTDFSSIQ